MEIDQNKKTGLAVVLLVLAILRLAFHESLSDKMDLTFFALLGVAFLVMVLPWEQLKSFKAGSVEFTLEQPSVQAAISGLKLDRLEDEELKNKLSNLGKELEVARGSRVLWIDDKPHNILGARRVLRSLGIEVTTAVSSDMALKILNGDNDFDLIISDVQRQGDNYKQVDRGVDIHEGVNFIVVLRKHKDKNISAIPVIFYAAYDWKRLVEFTRPAREIQPEAEISNTMEDFLPKVVKRLADVRSKPIVFSATKRPTSVD